MRRLGFLGCLLLGISLALPLQGMREQIVITDKGCFGCPCPCGKYSNVKKYKSQVEGPEYETIVGFGANRRAG